MEDADKFELIMLEKAASYAHQDVREQEARRLRREYARDWFVCAVVSFDHAIRRLAQRLSL